MSVALKPSGIAAASQVELDYKSSHGPALAQFNEMMMLGWTGDQSPFNLNISDSTDGIKFPNDTILPQTSVNAPALAAGILGKSDSLFLGWAGTDQKNCLNVASSSDGVHFGAAVTLPQSSRQQPALLVSDSTLTLAWTGVDADGHINLATSTDGVNFSSANTLKQTSVAGPALTSFNGVLYLAWAGSDADNSLNVAAAPYSNPVTFPHTTTHTPALASYNNRLYVAWTNDKNQPVYTSSKDGITFPSAPATLGATSRYGVALLVFDGDLCLGFTDENNRLNIVPIA